MQMRRAIALAAALALLASASPASAQTCNHHDGNCPYSVNYNAAGYGEISVCNISENIDPQAVQHAMDAWNDMIGKPLLTASCAVPTGIVVRDVAAGDCGDVACADYPYQENPLLLRIMVEPGASGWSLGCQKSLMVHEMGHNLGFSHWAVCNSVMHATLCDCDFLEPTAVDADNYEMAYWVEAVTNVTASSPSSGTVSLDWSPVNSAGEQLCNEKEFSVWRRSPSSGSYDTHVATAGQNSAGVSFGGQPSYGQCYRVWSVTLALPVSFAGHESIGVDVRPGSGGQDRDCDYWTDARENYLGTDSWDDCPDNSSDDAWPLDINKDRVINSGGDVKNYSGRMGARPGSPNWWQRLDLNADGSINAGGDVIKYSGKIGARCTNP